MCSISNRSQNKEKIAAVLLENTFTSIPDIARLLFPFRLKCNSSFHDSCNKCSCGCRIIKWLPVWFYKNQFKSGRKACRITQPTLFLSGLSDQVKCLNKYLKGGKNQKYHYKLLAVDSSKNDDRPVHNLWRSSEKISKVEMLLSHGPG